MFFLQGRFDRWSYVQISLSYCTYTFEFDCLLEVQDGGPVRKILVAYIVNADYFIRGKMTDRWSLKDLEADRRSALKILETT